MREHLDQLFEDLAPDFDVVLEQSHSPSSFDVIEGLKRIEKAAGIDFQPQAAVVTTSKASAGGPLDRLHSLYTSQTYSLNGAEPVRSQAADSGQKNQVPESDQSSSKRKRKPAVTKNSSSRYKGEHQTDLLWRKLSFSRKTVRDVADPFTCPFFAFYK